jgi:hypothetical protein
MVETYRFNKGKTKMTELLLIQAACENCCFSRQDDQTEVYTLSCHKHAPRPSVGVKVANFRTDWPPVYNNDWCGEWKAIASIGTLNVNKSIRTLQLGIRARRAIAGAVYNDRTSIEDISIGQLLACSAEDLGEQKDFGGSTLARIRSALNYLGLKLRGD